MPQYPSSSSVQIVAMLLQTICVPKESSIVIHQEYSTWSFVLSLSFSRDVPCVVSLHVQLCVGEMVVVVATGNCKTVLFDTQLVP